MSYLDKYFVWISDKDSKEITKEVMVKLPDWFERAHKGFVTHNGNGCVTVHYRKRTYIIEPIFTGVIYKKITGWDLNMCNDFLEWLSGLMKKPVLKNVTLDECIQLIEKERPEWDKK